MSRTIDSRRKRHTARKTKSHRSPLGQSKRLRMELLEPRRLLTADLTEITSLSALTLAGGDRTLIEIGGATAGNPPGGNDVDGFDQIQVANNAALDGTLEVRLVNNYVPDVGTTFDFLTVGGARSGSFANAEGLFSFPDGDRYFDVVSNGNGLRLEVKAAPGGLHFSPPAASEDGFGKFLSDYFSETSFSYTGDLSVGGFATFSGNLSFQESGGDMLAVADNVTATMAVGSFSTGVTGGTLGLVVKANDTKAVEARGGVAISGGGFASVTAD